MSEQSCAKCRFMTPSFTMKLGGLPAYFSCRRHPPVLTSEPNARFPHTFFPRINPDDWCGEFVEEWKEDTHE